MSLPPSLSPSQPDVALLQKKEAEARLGGGTAKIDKQHKGGKVSVEKRDEMRRGARD